MGLDCPTALFESQEGLLYLIFRILPPELRWLCFSIYVNKWYTALSTLRKHHKEGAVTFKRIPKQFHTFAFKAFALDTLNVIKDYPPRGPIERLSIRSLPVADHTDKELVMQFVRCQFKHTYHSVSTFVGNQIHPMFWADKDVVLMLVKKRGTFLKKASTNLRNDFEVAKHAIEQNWESSRFVGESLRENRKMQDIARKSMYDFVHKYVGRLRRGTFCETKTIWNEDKSPPPPARKMLEDLRTWQFVEPELVRRAALQNWRALRFAAPTKALRCDKEFMSQIVAQHWKALQYGSLEVRSDRRIVLCAVVQNWRAIRYAAGPWREDADIKRLVSYQKGGFSTCRTCSTPFRRAMVSTIMQGHLFDSHLHQTERRVNSSQKSVRGARVSQSQKAGMYPYVRRTLFSE